MGELCCREVPGKCAQVYSALLTSSCSASMAKGYLCVCPDVFVVLTGKSVTSSPCF